MEVRPLCTLRLKRLNAGRLTRLNVGKKTHPIYELTNLLFTGKTSGAMREFLGGSGKLSERVSYFTFFGRISRIV